jgi:hypothetical protein
MTREQAAREAFAQQAVWCAKLGSPFTAAVMAAVMAALGSALDRTSETGRIILDWPGEANARADAVPLRLAGALHALARRGTSADLTRLYPPNPLPDPTVLRTSLMAAIAAHDGAIAGWLASPPQTNEIARSAALYSGLMEIAAATGLPLALFELGASAGLNSIPDRYGYVLGGRSAGRAGSPVTLAPRWSGPAPRGIEPRIVSRRACDRAPLDVTKPGDRERLIAYVWADQAERLARTAAAIDLALADPVAVEQAEAAAWVEAVLPIGAAPGLARVLFHSIAYQYFPEATKNRIAGHLQAIGRAATSETPIAWLAFEQFAEEGPRLTLTLWPDGEPRVLAKGDAHGRSLTWLA